MLAHDYHTLVHSKKLDADPAQFTLLETLDTLTTHIVQYLKKRNRLVSKLLRHRTATTPPRGLYIHGNVGQGKSMLMHLFYTHLPVPRKRFVHFHTLMEEIHQSMHQWHQHDDKQRAHEDGLLYAAHQLVQSYDVLCIDELHITEIGDAMIISRLFGLLIAQGVILVVTSNRIPTRLYLDGVDKQYFKDFIALLEAHMQTYSLAARHDYRTVQPLTDIPVYLCPLNARTQQQINNWKQSLLGATTPPGVTLQIHERTLHFPIATPTVLVADFNDLCATSLGPADYLLIATTFHTVLLKNIPALTAAERNEAKRFVTLIDHLYQEKVRFICSAATTPEHLYLKGDGSFEFERTVSRLREMQSVPYLASAKHVL